MFNSHNDLSPNSRVWVYQSSRPFSPSEKGALQSTLDRFVEHWTSHNRSLRAQGLVLHEQFILLMVDESQADASGCSIDKSVHFLQQIERDLGVQLFDRMTFAWLQDGQVRTAHRDEFAQLYAAQQLNDRTLVFDNLVKTKAELESGWLKPLAESWHKRMV